MEEVLEVYARPYNACQPVVNYDESPKQLVSEVRTSYIDKYGVKHEDSEYEREGAADVVMIVESLKGHREVLVQEDHTGATWANNMAYIVEKMYPDAAKITIVLDNLSSHKKHQLYKVFDPERARNILNKIEFVYTPKHGSWLNIAECELSVLSRQALQQRFATKEQLALQVQTWASQRNNQQRTVDWQFKTADARIKLKSLYPTILN